MGRKKKPKLPAPGEAFAFPLADGRYSICRVLRVANIDEAEVWGANSILVAGSSWIGREVPSVDDPSLRPILSLTHHSWKNTPVLLWTCQEPPTNFVPIGTIEPTAQDLEIECVSSGGWEHYAIQPLLQWRWDNDREAVLAQDQVSNQKQAERYEAANREREAYLRQITLEQLATQKFFVPWKAYTPIEAIRASRKIMKSTIKQLIELGPDSPEGDRLAILQRCIEAFNELNDELGFIETIEREDICEEFEAIVHACGLGSQEDLADRWRDW